MATSYLSKRENEVPGWYYNLVFCYTTYKFERQATTKDDKEVFQSIETFTFYNARHRVTGELVLTKADGSDEFAADLTVNSWSWDSAAYTKENRLGLKRGTPFNTEDRLAGSTTINMAVGDLIDRFEGPIAGSYYYRATGTRGMQAFAGTDTIYFYDAVGRISEAATFERAAETVELTSGEKNKKFIRSCQSFINNLISAARGRIIQNEADPFPQSYATDGSSFFNVKPLLHKPFSMKLEIYQELSSEMHRVSKHEYTHGGFIVGQAKTVLAPIAKLGRIASLNTGKWLPVDLSESPIALAARYNGWIFNNGYINLLNPGDVGLQQIIGAVDADYVFYWERDNIAAFDDIRTLRSALTGYMSILGALTCRQLKIRHAYLPYVTAIITMVETLRGVDANASGTLSHYGVHSKYPFISQITTSYRQYLGTAFNLIRVDTGANDSANSLQQLYEQQFAAYNAVMHGQSIRVGRELSKLGASVSGNAASYLRGYSEMVKRMLVADVDKELTNAFMNDRAMSGDIPLNDPAITVNPGDTAELNFLDESLIKLKVTGLSISCDMDDINYRVSVKRLPS